MAVKVAEVFRGVVLESTHMGNIVAVNSGGRILYKAGDSKRITYFRSTFKPIQILAALQSGIVEKYNINLREIAIMVSSHTGEKSHIEVINGIMEKLDINEDSLECGIHEPLDKEALKVLYSTGGKPSKIHCNCSGKHLAMLAAAMAKGIAIKGYHKHEHLLHDDIDEIITLFCNVEKTNIIKGVDGCGVPIHAVPLLNVALSYANLCDNDFQGGRFNRSQNYVINAMTMYPEMVSGKGRFDTDIMKKLGGRIICKMGAEGMCCVGLPGKSTGIVVKIEDGSSRAVSPVVMDILHEMRIISREEAEELGEYWKPPILNHKGEHVGEIIPVVKF